MFVGGKNMFPAGEGADQHEQARLREMEVGDESADEAEFEAGRDKDVGGARVGLNRSITGRVCGGFEGADYGGADGDYASLLCSCGVN